MKEKNLITFILNEKQNLLDLVIPLIETKNFLIQNEPDIFHEEIESQFNETLNRIIVEEFSKKFTTTPEDVMLMMENVKLEEFFKC